MSSNAPNNESTPWYKQFWPWFILAILGWGVVSASITLAVAVRNPPQMMTGDYAKLGKALVDTHQRADAAEALALGAQLSMDGGRVSLTMAADDPSALDDMLLLLVQHPTDAGRDRQLQLRRIADGRYVAEGSGWPERGRLIASDLGQTWWISSVYRIENGRVEATLAPERL